LDCKVWRAKLAERVGFEPTVGCYLLCFNLHNRLSFILYLPRTLRFEKEDRILGPGAAHVGLRLLLTLPNPRRIMLLRDLDAGVA
jgi:hypothetical protein